MFLLLVLAILTICFTASEPNETKQRIASLVVLPPLVLGYDELYHESMETGKETPKPQKRVRIPSPNNTRPHTPPDVHEIVTESFIKATPAPPIPLKNKQPAAALAKNKKPVAATAKKKELIEAPEKIKIEKRKPMKPAVASEIDNKPKATKQNTKRREKNPQRTIIIDTKGRRNFRRNYRSVLKKRTKNTRLAN